MNPLRTILVVVGLTTAITSCGSKPEEPDPEPVKKPPVVRSAPPAPAIDTNPTDMFRDDSGNVAMPSDDQLDEGKDSSIGTGQPVTSPNTGPSIAISPPSALAPTAPQTPAVTPTPKTPEPKKPLKKEDQLNPE